MFEMNSPPLLSIIMPTYNRANFIIETIESIQNQTHTNWELLIIDDGSNDNTEELVISINDNRIHYYKEIHQGMEKARKTGLERAKGELIGFMDSDDLWAPTKLEKQVKVFEDNPEIHFSLTGGYEFMKCEEPLVFFYNQRTGIKKGELFIPFFQSRFVAVPQTLVFKKACLNNVNFSENLELAHIHFILSLALQFKGAILYEALLHRRLHDDNFSTVHQVKRHFDGIKLIRHYKKNLPPHIFADALLRSQINFGETCLKNNQRLKALSAFTLAWKYKPHSIIPIKKIAKVLFYK